jgi:ferrochelatase
LLNSKGPNIRYLKPAATAGGSDKTMIGVVLLNLGGPDSLDAVEPFLYNLFSDPDIIDFPGSFLFRKRLAKLISTRRSPMVRKQYEKIGGKSPLKDHTLKQAALLEERLNERFPARVYAAMRYWRPSTEETLDEIEREGIRKVVLLPLYPQYSKATTESSVKEWEKKLGLRPNLALETDLIESYFDFPEYIDAFVDRINEGLTRFPEEERGNTHIVFSAHGTPMKLVRQGDPYSGHIKQTIEAIMSEGAYEQNYSLCYQSKVGPMKWLTPSTPDTIMKLASEGVKRMLVVPVAFASDHLETLFELGIEYRRVADEAGIEQYEVTTGLNDSPIFIDALATLVFEKLGVSEETQAATAAK